MVAANATRLDARGPVVYERRRPERTVLYQTLQKHLKPFIADVEARGDRALPYFVKKELRDLRQ